MIKANTIMRQDLKYGPKGVLLPLKPDGLDHYQGDRRRNRLPHFHAEGRNAQLGGEYEADLYVNPFEDNGGTRDPAHEDVFINFAGQEYGRLYNFRLSLYLPELGDGEELAFFGDSLEDLRYKVYLSDLTDLDFVLNIDWAKKAFRTKAQQQKHVRLRRAVIKAEDVVHKLSSQIDMLKRRIRENKRRGYATKQLANALKTRNARVRKYKTAERRAKKALEQYEVNTLGNELDLYHGGSTLYYRDNPAKARKASLTKTRAKLRGGRKKSRSYEQKLADKRYEAQRRGGFKFIERDNPSFSRVRQIMMGQVPSIRTVGIFTAQNPRATKLPPKWNKALNKKLMAWLRERGYGPIPIGGMYGMEEDSYLVPNITREDTVEVGLIFDQESVIWASRVGTGRQKRMVWQFIEGTRTVITRDVSLSGKDIQSRKDYYSIVRGRKFLIPFFDEKYSVSARRKAAAAKKRRASNRTLLASPRSTARGNPPPRRELWSEGNWTIYLLTEHGSGRLDERASFMIVGEGPRTFHADYPVVYDGVTHRDRYSSDYGVGAVGYDRPEAIPQKVHKAFLRIVQDASSPKRRTRRNPHNSAYSTVTDQYGNRILQRLLDMGYTPIRGMEGPFMMNGYIAYYDRMEGEYYSRDNDMYYSVLGIDVTKARRNPSGFTGSAEERNGKVMYRPVVVMADGSKRRPRMYLEADSEGIRASKNQRSALGKVRGSISLVGEPKKVAKKPAAKKPAAKKPAAKKPAAKKTTRKKAETRAASPTTRPLWEVARSMGVETKELVEAMEAKKLRVGRTRLKALTRITPAMEKKIAALPLKKSRKKPAAKKPAAKKPAAKKPAAKKPAAKKPAAKKPAAKKPAAKKPAKKKAASTRRAFSPSGSAALRAIREAEVAPRRRKKPTVGKGADPTRDIFPEDGMFNKDVFLVAADVVEVTARKGPPPNNPRKGRKR